MEPTKDEKSIGKYFKYRLGKYTVVIGKIIGHNDNFSFKTKGIVLESEDPIEDNFEKCIIYKFIKMDFYNTTNYSKDYKRPDICEITKDEYETHINLTLMQLNKMLKS